MDKNFGLSESAFSDLVNRLRKGDESLYEKVFLQHFESCLEFVQKKYNASYRDAYDASMDAMLLFCKRLKEGKIQYGNLRFLFTQMAGQIYLKWVKKESQIEAFTDIDIIDEPQRFDEETLGVLEKAFSKLGENCSELLKAFYFNEQSLKLIAEKRRQSAAAIRKQKQRCIEQLRQIFTKIS